VILFKKREIIVVQYILIKSLISFENKKGMGKGETNAPGQQATLRPIREKESCLVSIFIL
jgi:hypothetical protein